MPGSCRSPLVRRMSFAVLIATSALTLGACQNKDGLDGVDPLTTGSTAPASLKETAKLGERWQADPKNLQLGLAYANQLKKLGQNDRHLQVLATLAQYHPNDQKLLTLYGRELAQAGQSAQAQTVLTQAITAGSTDWKV